MYILLVVLCFVFTLNALIILDNTWRGVTQTFGYEMISEELTLA